MTTPDTIRESVRIARKINQLKGVKSVKTAGMHVPKYSNELYPIAMTGQYPERSLEQHRNVRGTSRSGDASHGVFPGHLPTRAGP